MLRIMSLNVNYYVDRHGPWSARRELIAETIRSTRPDIIALQAVRKDPGHYRGVDQATQLANLVPDYKYVQFEPATRTSGGGAEGSAVLSHLPFAANDTLPLSLVPNLDDKNRRLIIRAQFDLRFLTFNLFNAHFSWVEEQAESNVKEALPFIDSPENPSLLVGDLNQPPDSPAMQRFAAEGWTDVWAALCPGQDGYTFETGNLTKRIDYAWANLACKPRLEAIDIVGPGPSGPDISDHLGLLITLDLSI